jgi:hypothetical protein
MHMSIFATFFVSPVLQAPNRSTDQHDEQHSWNMSSRDIPGRVLECKHGPGSGPPRLLTTIEEIFKCMTSTHIAAIFGPGVCACGELYLTIASETGLSKPIVPVRNQLYSCHCSRPSRVQHVPVGFQIYSRSGRSGVFCLHRPFSPCSRSLRIGLSDEGGEHLRRAWERYHRRGAHLAREGLLRVRN